MALQKRTHATLLTPDSSASWLMGLANTFSTLSRKYEATFFSALLRFS